MDIQTFNGSKYNQRNDLVLYVHVQIQPTNRLASNEWVAEIYETSPEEFRTFDPNGQVPILYCHGTGRAEFKNALTLIDVLYGESNKTTIRPYVETWLVQMQTDAAAAYTLYVQIYNKGRWTHLCEPEYWINNKYGITRTDYPTRMVSKTSDAANAE